MILLWVLLLPLAGGLVAWAGGKTSRKVTVIAPIIALALDCLLLVWLWGRHSGFAHAPGSFPWIAEFSMAWIPQFGIEFALAMDGLALLMSLMVCTVSLAVFLVLGSSIPKNAGLHALLFMLAVTSVFGVFLSADLMLFFIFFEAMLLPTYALMIGWGEGDQSRSAMRFFVFTQAGGLLMLISIIAVYMAHATTTGEYTFSIVALAQNPMSGPLSLFCLLGFVIAFAVKLPLVPFHTWQPDAYAGSSTAVTILLAALMTKTAGYGLIRFAIPLFPEASTLLAPWMMGIGVATILYASWLAFGQSDLKRIVAYSSAAHLGYVVLGAFAMNEIGHRGAIIQMFCHGISVTGVFFIIDWIERRANTRNIAELGGLSHSAPRMGAIAMVFVMATLGLPGLGNFIGEFFTLTGAFQAHWLAGSLAATGAVLAAAYSLRIMQQVFFGPKRDLPEGHEPYNLLLPVATVLIIILVYVGMHPGPVLEAANSATGFGAIDTRMNPTDALLVGNVR
ncbi:MAG: NADH-quinone oxidoreductase subunit M [Candidatus Hydrogenedentes bacterium]|nr:NADH-quinone oxidoreductase subunit M [Candidatus Hydrogenedentota bacterium]